MRILQVHKYLYPRDGASTYLFGIVELLKQHGHDVMMWGTGENAECRMQNAEWLEDLLVEHLNFDRREGFLRDFKKFGRMIWSFEAARKFEEVLLRFKPDVIHAHNIYHHISPSILKVAARHKIPVVMTVHDYHLINPNYVLYDHGVVCERSGVAAIMHRCIKNSYTATGADVIETGIHKLMGVYRKHVAEYLAPTNFVRSTLVEHGMYANQIKVVPLPVDISSRSSSRSARIHPRQGEPKGSHYILFAGRLAQEKGVYAVLELAKRLPKIQFLIAGTGPEIENVELRIKNVELSNVELLGFVEKGKLQALIAGARLILVPSLWHEPSPYAVLEAQAAGKPVIASSMGGIPELIEDGKTGFLVKPDMWVDTIQKVFYDEALLKRVGIAARTYVKRVHNPEKHYEKLIKVYEEVMEKL